jgi:Na+-translocating ferredoxin:NAD+ oxidoreductase RnfD subunit
VVPSHRCIDRGNPFGGLPGGRGFSLGETLHGEYFRFPWRDMRLVGISFSFVLGHAGISSVPDPLFSMLSGSFLFGTFFVVTEPISGPKTEAAQWIYGFIIGGLTIVLRRYSNFSEGIMFAVLFMNMFVPVMDMAVREWKSRGKRV